MPDGKSFLCLIYGFIKLRDEYQVGPVYQQTDCTIQITFHDVVQDVSILNLQLVFEFVIPPNQDRNYPMERSFRLHSDELLESVPIKLKAGEDKQVAIHFTSQTINFTTEKHFHEGITYFNANSSARKVTSLKVKLLKESEEDVEFHVL